MDFTVASGNFSSPAAQTTLLTSLVSVLQLASDADLEYSVLPSGVVSVTYEPATATQVSAAQSITQSTTFLTAMQTAVSAGSSGLAVSAQTTTPSYKLGQDEVDAILAGPNDALFAPGGTYDSCQATNETLVTGYITGAAIELNHEATQLTTASGNTELELHFFVQRRYTEMYQQGTFAITFHDRSDTINADSSLCYSNRNAAGMDVQGYADCTTSNAGWSINNDLTGNDCWADLTATFSWTDIMDMNKVASRSLISRADYTIIYITADIDTWVYFEQSSAELGQGYTQGAQTTTFPEIKIIQERYTFAQTPFALLFPATVEVSTSFTTGTAIAVISAVVEQKQSQLNLNPDSSLNQPFATTDITVRVQVQYPYAFRDFGAAVGAAVVQITNGTDNVDRIEFISMDSPSACVGLAATEMCEQEITFRIWPTNCNFEAEYALDLWLSCANPPQGQSTTGCGGLDGAIGSTTSNSYVPVTFSSSGDGFCPTLIDEYSVSATFEVFHDELFSQHVQLTAADTDPTHIDPVYTNDILYNKVNFYATSNKMQPAGTQVQSVLDKVRTTSIYLSVSIDTAHLAIVPADIDGDLTNFVQTATSTSFDLKLCEAQNVPFGANPDDYLDCFQQKTYGNAIRYLDFHPQYNLVDPITGTGIVGQRDLAFSYRVDERVFPIAWKISDQANPSAAGTFDSASITVNVAAEIYWKGGNVGRRLLQSPAGPSHQKNAQLSQFFQTFPGFRPVQLSECKLPEANTDGSIILWFQTPLGFPKPDHQSVNSWITTFQYQLGSVLGMRKWNQISIDELAFCDVDDGCTVLVSSTGYVPGRRLNLAFSRIQFSIAGDGSATGAQYMNKLQYFVVNNYAALKSVDVLFDGTQVNNMHVIDCHKTATAMLPSGYKSQLASSASSLSVALVFVAATLTALF